MQNRIVCITVKVTVSRIVLGGGVLKILYKLLKSQALSRAYFYLVSLGSLPWKTNISMLIFNGVAPTRPFASRICHKPHIMYVHHLLPAPLWP